MNPIDVPLPEPDVEAGQVEGEIKADPDQCREGRRGSSLRALTEVEPPRDPPGDGEGAVDNGVLAEQDGQRHASHPVPHVVTQEPEGACGEEFVHGWKPGAKGKEQG